MTHPSTRSELAEERKSKKRPIAAFVLATIAFTGLGAGLTSAAWTDNVFFGTTAAAATFNLQGSLSGGPADSDWKESAAASPIELQIPATSLANLLPGQTRTITLYVRNTGSVNAALVSTVAFDAPTAFTPDTVLTVAPSTSTLAAGATATITVTVTTPSGWAESNKGKSSTVTVKIAGEAVA